MSPATVARMTVPLPLESPGFIRALRIGMASFTTSPAMMRSARKYSPSSNFLPTISSPLLMPSWMISSGVSPSSRQAPTSMPMPSRSSSSMALRTAMVDSFIDQPPSLRCYDRATGYAPNRATASTMTLSLCAGMVLRLCTGAMMNLPPGPSPVRSRFTSETTSSSLERSVSR